MKEKKIKRSKVLIILVTSLVAILVISMTVGRELYQGRTQSIWSFGLIHFSGYLFFLLMPVEMAFIYYLSYYEEVELIMVAMGTAVIAQVMDYLIGYSFSAKFMHDLVGTKRIQRAERYIRKYGNLTVFVFNGTPLSSPIIALVAGMIKYRFRDLMMYSISGLLIKYIILSLLFANTNWF
jgi:membrane protein DedA with SNARE-associated domain